MATVYKRKQDAHKKRAAWYIGYKDANGRQKTVKGYSDKGESERYAAKLEEEARLIRDGLKAPDEAERIRAKKLPIRTVVDDFEKQMKNRDITEKQIFEVVSRVKKVVEGAKFKTITDITASKVETYLKELRDSGRSRQTSNHYLRAIQQFTKWLTKTRKLPENPLSDITKLNTQVDRRHDRRPLSVEEFARLVASAEVGKPNQSISGSDRAILYILAAWTGYRRSELASLTPSSFDFSADPPTITVAAVYSKRKRTDSQMIHPSLVSRIQAWLEKKSAAPNQILLPVSDKVEGGVDRRTSEMMQMDLASARTKWINEAANEQEKKEREASDFLKYKDSQNRFADFHANRHTFITNLSKAKVAPRVAQELARHSDIRLTLGIYTHTSDEDKQRALQSLPVPWECIGSKSESGPDTNRQCEAERPSKTPNPTVRSKRANSKENTEIRKACLASAQNDSSLTNHRVNSDALFWRPSPLPGEHS